MLSVPRSWADLTPSWMTAALARRHPGSVVATVDVGSVADGTNRRATVRLTYAEGAGPTSVFVKAQGRLLHRLALVALGALTTEARLAESGLDLPLERPQPFAGAIDRNHLAAVVVMDDVLAVDGRPNDANTPLRVAEVEAGLTGLAQLHAAYWARPLPPSASFLRPWRLGSIWAPVSAGSLSRGLRRIAELGRPGLVPRGTNTRILERQFRRSASRAEEGPQTVLHGDPHPGNTYGLPGDRTGFYDWQLVRTGNWSHDVGYFLVSSLSVDDRREHERQLLSGYLDTLRRAGVIDAPSFEAAWNQYRATPAFGLGTWLHTLSAGSFQPVDVCVSTLARFAAAYDDLETLDAFG